MSNMKLQSFFDNIDKLSVSESILKLSRRGEERGGEGRGEGRGEERRVTSRRLYIIKYEPIDGLMVERTNKYLERSTVHEGKEGRKSYM